MYVLGSELKILILAKVETISCDITVNTTRVDVKALFETY